MTKDTIEDAFDFLDNLRDSGVTNMWGATPFLARHMKVGDHQGGPACKLHCAWIDSFRVTNDGDLDARVAWAVGELI